MQARSYCLYCTYPPSSLGQIDDLRARLAALQQAAVKRQSMAIKVISVKGSTLERRSWCRRL